ncbi:MAG: TIM barrel protein [Verrucomicrobia bacterium]|nr:TIM barrel protein [Verrucomicrobiota bacterium]MCG2679653.1 TIM barrel protein [Kiritimatiellia bacterium]MBU4247946.1 TIM barrel protein [Verrucomicrobiota bacterium]MBU4291443.1 TIM barrel protein [Verrucomicrobiota bacterium]MBU4428377.1 TIM barrel protein [Verrucomicrobiota bacterium]
MIKTGLVSVTFRKLAPAAIINLVRQADLAAIEWGGDIHVPHGNLQQADTVGRMTRDAGLAIAAYGSYYRVGASEQEGLTFDRVLETARALGAPLIRIWAGNRPSAKADADYRRSIGEEARRLAEKAAAAGLVLACEYHGGTLTDTSESAVQLFSDIQHPAMRAYWQTPVGASVEAGLESLRAMIPWLTNVHVYHCDAAETTCLPLSEGADAWRRYLALIRSTGRDHYALLEFVRDDSPNAFLEDARFLKSWLAPKI